MKYPKIVGYELIQKIGGGAFSSVFRAVHLENHLVAACKLVQITEHTTEKDRKTVDKEMKIHSALKHKNILEFLNAAVVEPKYKYHYVPGIYMLLEFAAGGDLFDKIVPDVGVGEEVAHLYFNQLLAGMAYIHSQGVCHRDLKPENLLLDAAGTLKISDFGLSAVYKLLKTGEIRPLSERCGSLPYIAPELNYNQSYQAEPIDVWGMGIILFTLLAGNTPWDEPTARSPEFCRYVSGEILREDPWSRLGQNALSLVCSILTLDPSNRMSLADVAAHPWCMRPSQLASRGVQELAEQLTQPLRDSGDLMYVDLDESGSDSGKDPDGDDIMMSVQTQFTQTLLLFSQTQNGRRYNPHLTRFYARQPPNTLIDCIKVSLEQMDIQYKVAPTEKGDEGTLHLRVGGKDMRREVFKGWIDIEPWTRYGDPASFCVMRRDSGCPITWRKFWKALIESPAVSGYVMRKNDRH